MTSGLASLRLRVLSPMRALGDVDFQHKLVPIMEDTNPPPWEAALDGDILIFSKSFLPSNEALAREARARGLPVILDICDNHYEHAEYGAHYQAMSALADQVVCNSSEMARIAQPYCQRPPVVIEDPYEGPRGAPRYSPGEQLRLLWFGHPLNLGSLEMSLGDLIGYGARRPVSLTILTQLNPTLVAFAPKLSKERGPAFQMQAEAWSLTAQWEALAACDAVVIPSRPDATKQVKSANRMVEALWAGRPVVAQPMPAYLPFGEWAPILPMITQGLAGLEARAGEVEGLISRAQSYIEARHSPSVIGGQWKEVVRNTRSHPAAAT